MLDFMGRRTPKAERQSAGVLPEGRAVTGRQRLLQGLERMWVINGRNGK